MIEAYEAEPGMYVGVKEVDEAEVSKYGIVELKKKGSRQIISIVEKPDPKTTPSRLAVFGRYILTPDIFEALEKIPLGKSGELWIADGIEYLLKRQAKAYFEKIKDGEWYTTGDPVSYLKAIRAFALAREEYKDAAKEIFA